MFERMFSGFLWVDLAYVALFLLFVVATVFFVYGIIKRHDRRGSLFGLCLSYVLVCLVYFPIITPAIFHADVREGHGLEFVNSTNPEFLTGLNIVKKLEGFDYLLTGDRVGFYDAVGKRIYLKEQYKDTWWHELGHHVWYYHLNNTERADFSELYYEDYELFDDNKSSVGFATAYAMTSVEEDWAESFELYVSSSYRYSSRRWVRGPGEKRVKIIESFLRRTVNCTGPSCVFDYNYSRN